MWFVLLWNFGYCLLSHNILGHNIIIRIVINVCVVVCVCVCMPVTRLIIFHMSYVFYYAQHRDDFLMYFTYGNKVISYLISVTVLKDQGNKGMII